MGYRLSREQRNQLWDVHITLTKCLTTTAFPTDLWDAVEENRLLRDVHKASQNLLRFLVDEDVRGLREDVVDG